MANQLQSDAGGAKYYENNSGHFIKLIKKGEFPPGDLIVSFDMVSLSNIPIKEWREIKYKPPVTTPPYDRF